MHFSAVIAVAALAPILSAYAGDIAVEVGPDQTVRLSHLLTVPSLIYATIDS